MKKRKVHTAQTVVESREKAHGNYKLQSDVTQDLKKILRKSPNWGNMAPEQCETLEMLCVKMGRIVTGDANFPDHWLDLAGYPTMNHNILTKGTHL